MVGVKMVETSLKWFGHVERRLVDFVVRRVDHIWRVFEPLEIEEKQKNYKRNY